MLNTQNFENRYKSLNKKQKDAVDTLEGPVLVVAGPGSGKTEILSLRVANLIKEGTTRAEYILCLTFTDSACTNMRDRLIKIIGREAYKVPIFTFHSFCTSIISKYPEHFFDAHHFEPISELNQNQILNTIFSEIKYGNPLFGNHSEKGYAYIYDVKERIKNFKEAGWSPDDLRKKIKENKKELEVITGILKENIPARITKDSVHPLIQKLYNSGTELGVLYSSKMSDLVESGMTGKIKSSLLSKDEEGQIIFKESKYTEKFLALADIYEKYQKKLWNEGYFDFNDMILYVRDKLNQNDELRAEVEETYQYILVDEFQDTNKAQLDLVKSITSNPVLEGKANVFVVGDDDQSVYKFQGAELSNIFNFRKMYKDVATIVLEDNYRSTQRVLDFAKKMIDQGEERLVKKDKTLNKDLVSKNKNLLEGDIYLNSFNTKEEELLFVADEIKKLLDKGVKAEEISIISRRHRELQEILPYLDDVSVPYNYERKESVFDQKHIAELILICEFLETVSSGIHIENDELLSKILSFDFLEIDRIDIWNIARGAKDNKRTWLDEMSVSDNTSIREFAHFLIELGVLSKSTSLEIILDTIIGSRNINIESSENEDEYYHNSIPKLKTNYKSNYKEYYFGKDIVKGDIASFVHFLSSLKVFIYALRDYKKGDKLLVSDLSGFVNLHKEYNVALLNKTAFSGNINAINLMTAHKAKGLEFEYVFLIGVEDSKWVKGKINNKLPLALNMPFDRQPDNSDDFLRLFFVAITRSKHTIYLTHTENILSFIADEQEKSSLKRKESCIENDKLLSGLSVYKIPPFAKDERALLNKILENYAISPTHLSNFLNVTKGGPKLFLEQNLLQFPQTKTSSAVYGTAIHRAIEELYVVTKKNKKIPEISFVLDVFEKEIKKGRLLREDEENLILKGKESINIFYNNQKHKILDEAPFSKTEVDFRNQGVEVSKAILTGKIDRIIDTEGSIKVIDLKSGKELSSFEYKKSKEDDYENIKKHNYKQQLMMYKLLLENSRDYSSKKVEKGSLVFVDSINTSELILNFDSVSAEEIKDFKKLVQVVYTKIMNLDFPDISKYEKNINGIIQFEKDLIK